MDLANSIYNYDRLRSEENGAVQASTIKAEIMVDIEKDSMASLYTHLCDKYGWDQDATLLTKMQEANAKAIEKIDLKREEALSNAGDSEVLDAMFEKARFYLKTGSWTEAYEAYDLILAKEKTAAGKKIDANMEKARIALFSLETPRLKEILAEAKRLNELGGDWDRRNRLKVYEALYLLLTRDIKGASKLFLECVATFTCTELCTYKQFMFFALTTSVIALDRTELRKKVINDPHVITVIRDLPNVASLVRSIYDCDYQKFFQSILSTLPEITQNRFLGPLTVYLVREYRLLAYSQFLEAYQSVMFSSMAQSFGISAALLDSELSRFIASGRLNAKIDKVGDIIVTSRPDKKNQQYQEVIKKGDLLLNKVQKLVRAIDQ